MLDARDVDAVVVSTPDHWHALIAMMACAAGKDVYVEKPLTLFAREGRWMVQVANRHKRIVQVGTQQRSGPHYWQARELLRSGRLGKIHAVRMASFRNILPGFGSPPDADPPSELDWDMLLGPAPYRKYNPNRGLYHFRWFWDYSGGQMTNLGAHSLDIAHWILDVKGPQTVSSAGGRFALQDNGETPDTQDAILEYPGWTAVWSHREACAGRPGAAGLEFFGTHGSLTLSRGGFELFPDRKIYPANAIPRFTGPHPAGGPVSIPQSGPPEFWAKPEKSAPLSPDQDQFKLHVRNFLDCIKSRKQPNSDLESSHQVTTACHLANISLRLGRRLRWDPDKEQILGDSEANKMLERPYRKPWDGVLASLLR
jgi:predicted dehydrogenase